MRAYKFLAAGTTGRFSDLHWPLPEAGRPGSWVDVSGALEECSAGIHACRSRDLLDWIDDELWEIELEGELAELERVLIAARGRLLGRVESWDGEAMMAFAHACTWRARDHVVGALRHAGLDGEADRLDASDSLGELQAAAAAAGAESTGQLADLASLVADTVALVEGHRPDAWQAVTLAPPAVAQSAGAVAANIAFVVAHLSGLAAAAVGGDYDDGFAAERSRQLGWLTERLGLAAS